MTAGFGRADLRYTPVFFLPVLVLPPVKKNSLDMLKNQKQREAQMANPDQIKKSK